MTQKLHLALCFELPSGNVPEWVQLLPAGKMVGTDSRTFINNDPQQILDNKQRSNLHIPLDIEHATHLKGPIGEAAPAQGWFEQLEIREGQVWGKLNANEDGKALLEKQNYRYISPAFKHDANGHIFAIVSVGLTNQPNLDLLALNHQRNNHDQEITMKLPLAIATALVLNSETATEADAVTAIQTLQSDHKLALNRAESPSLDKFVPTETHQLALNRATEAEKKLTAIADTEIEALVDGAISDGKVAPANKAMYLATCRADGGIEQFKTFIKSAPTIANKTSQHKDKKTGEKADTLSPTELAMCRSGGLSEEEFLATKSQINVGDNA